MMERPLRSQPTRDRILQAAKTIFGEHGYDRTTIRKIAAAAQIHPSMVMRYYGSKEGLFTAAVNLDLQIPDLSSVPHSNIGRALVAHLLERWDSAEGQLPSLLRVSVTHDEARDRLLQVLRDQLAPIFEGFCEPGRARNCTALVATQVLGLALTRHVLRLPSVCELPESAIVDEIGATIQAYVDGGRAHTGEMDGRVVP